MILSIILLAAGVLGCAAAILLTVKKKLSPAWGASVTICALILGVFGGIGLADNINTRNREYGYIYTALRYMERRDTDPAALYLKRVTENNGYCLTSAQALLEQIRGNDTVAALRLSVLESIQDGSDEQKAGVTRLKTWQQSTNDVTAVTKYLLRMIPLSDKKKAELDRRFEIETGMGGGEAEGAELLYLRVNQSLGNNDWRYALQNAVELVRQNPSSENRLLLAQVLAEAKYGGVDVRTPVFLEAGDESQKDTMLDEYEKLEAKANTLSEDLLFAQQELSDADDDEREEISVRVESLTEQVNQLRGDAKNIFLKRALSSIADIHSLEAEVVRAKIYFAMGDRDRAIKILRDAANSIFTLFSDNRALVNALKLFDDVYDRTGETGVDTPEFREQTQVLLGGANPGLINLGLTPLVSAFTDSVISDQKVYGSNLYVVGLDTSEFPTIRVRLGGQEDVIRKLVDKDPETVNDTHSNIKSFTVEAELDDDALNSICFLVDISGSMGGGPLNDAKAAVNRFLDLLEGKDELALVAFESYAEVLVDMTTSASQIRNAANSLTDRGGTDITAGIQCGIQTLEHANGSKVMILMTDGQSSIDTSIVERAAEENITIFTVGFGGVDDELLQYIADTTNGQYIKAESSEELINVYSSLRGLIGNVVTVTYTVENTEEIQRYFYLDDGNGTTVRKEYYIGDGQSGSDGIELVREPNWCLREELDRMLSYSPDSQWTIELDGTRLDTVVSATIGGLPCQIDSAGYSYITLSFPASIGNGLHALTLTDGDGKTYTFPGVLAVGEELKNRRFVAGSLAVSSQKTVLLDDGTLVLVNPAFSEAAPIDRDTLGMSLNGIAVFEGPHDLSQTDPSDNYSLGVSGTALGYGTLNLNSGDLAYDSSAMSYLLSGVMELRYETDKSVIVPVKEGSR